MYRYAIQNTKFINILLPTTMPKINNNFLEYSFNDLFINTLIKKNFQTQRFSKNSLRKFYRKKR